MKYVAPLMMAVALAATAAPIAAAWADPGDGGGRGWRGGGRGEQGGQGGQGGQGWRGGGQGGWRGDGDGGGRGWRGGQSDGGRFQRDGEGDRQDGGRFQRDGGRYGETRGFRDPERVAEPQDGGRRARPLGGESRDAVAGVRQGLRPMGQVLSEIQRRQPGRQLDAGMESWSDGRPAYRVRWAAENGRRIDYVVDARTGAILSVEGR